jgi:glycerol-3-phosphate dehydrogenase
MIRLAQELSEQHFDVVVLGGGVLGACVARDSALRGLSTALVEADDFGGCTSANSLKVVHGGLRHLQHLDLRELRRCARERSTWLRIAPHLVEPLPVVMPLFRGTAEKVLYRTALAVNDFLSADRNHDLPAERSIPSGRALSRRECLDRIPELEPANLCGGVLYHDARMYSAERLVLAVVRGAAEAGAVVVNHAECTGPLIQGGQREGVEILDHLSGSTLAVRGRLIANASGPGATALTRRLHDQSVSHPDGLSLAWNLVVKSTGHDVAFALPGKSSTPTGKGGGPPRRLFYVPWRDRTLVGTGHGHFEGSPEEFHGMDREHPAIQAFIDEVNGSWPGGGFSADDAHLVHSGLLPAHPNRRGEVQLRRQHTLTEVAEGGVPVLTATTVKFTASRRVAEQAIDRACEILGHGGAPCRTASVALPGAPDEGMPALLAEAHRTLAGRLEADVIDHLVHSYGTCYPEVLACAEADRSANDRISPDSPVLRSQWVYAIRHEMAGTADDLLRRRTEFGARGSIESAIRERAEHLLAETRQEVSR